MNERSVYIGLISCQLQKADACELDLVWRFLCGLVGEMEVSK